MQAVADIFLLTLVAGWAFEAFDDHRLAAFHQQNAQAALDHALADGRASLEGYPKGVPPELGDFVEASTPPTFTPVPIDRAETAVAAETALASYATAQAAETRTDLRLLLSAIASSVVLGVGLLSPLISIVVGPGENCVRDWMKRRGGPTPVLAAAAAQ